MTFALKHGSRILKKPFKELLQKWHIRSIPFSTQMCVIAFTLLITMSRLASSDHQISGYWPLKYHHSPWLYKELLNSIKPDSNCESPKMTNKCHEQTSGDSGTRLISDGDRTALNNKTIVNQILPPNGSASKASNTMTNNNDYNDLSTASVLASTASDDTIATSAAPFNVINNQCLFLDGESTKSICDSEKGVPRMMLLQKYHLKYCHRYPLVNVLSSDAWQSLLHSVNSRKCQQILSELEMIDNIVNQLICEYDALLERYDCQNGFSVKWSCNDCKVS